MEIVKNSINSATKMGYFDDQFKEIYDELLEEDSEAQAADKEKSRQEEAD